MRLDEILQEGTVKGTYAGVRLSPSSAAKLFAYAQEHNVPSPIPESEYHVTLLYSRKVHPDYEAPGDYKTPLTARTKGFTLLGDEKDALVVLIDCSELEKRHHHLMKKHGATWDWPDYKPHVSLSYEAKGFDVSGLRASDIGTLTLTTEYREDLDLDE